MGRSLRHSIKGGLLCVAVLLVLLSSSGLQRTAHAAGTPSPQIDQVAQQVLLNIRANGWNPQAQIHGQTTGGLYINWQMDNPGVTNAGVTPTSHDPQVDLYYLNALAEYKSLHPQDGSYDGDLARILPLVQYEFANYNIPKGWIYFTLLRDGYLLQNMTLLIEAYVAASNFYNHWYDPVAGTVYNRAHTPGDYNVEHTLNCGAALIDAGKRWGIQTWVQAGQSTLDHTLAAAINPQYHLFYNSMIVQPNGMQQVEDYQAKPSTQGQGAEALVDAYNWTHNQNYLNAAGSILQAMFASPLWDQANGGLFFALDMSNGKLAQAYKETRGQTLSLIALVRYNQALSDMGQYQQFTDKQQWLTYLLTYRFYQPTYHGFFYRVTPTFQIFTSNPGQGIGYENFFTTEAMGTALDALQQTEFSHLDF